MAVLVAVIIVSAGLYQYWRSLSKGPFAIRYGYMPYSDCAPIFVAVDKGFFSEENLNVSLFKFFAGVKSIEAAVAGSIDMGFSAVYSVLVAYDGGINLKIATDGGHLDIDHDDSMIAVLKNSSIQSIADLKGKTIAVHSLVSPIQLALEATFQKYGFGLEDVNFEVISYPNIPEALLAGRVDAATLWQPSLSIALATGKVQVFRYWTELFPNHKYQMGTNFIMQSFIDQHKDAVDAFIRAYTKAVDWINENPQETRGIIANWTGLDPEVAKTMILKVWSTELDADAVKDIADLMLEYGEIEKEINLEDIIYQG